MDDIRRGDAMSPSEMEVMIRDQEVPWDDIRERRVLAEIMREKRKPSKPVGKIAALAAVVLVGMGAAFFWVFMRGEDLEYVNNTGEQQIAFSSSTLSLAEAGKAILYKGAEVQVVKQGTREVRLSQTKGRVRYEIERQEGRETEIDANGVLVRVIGTRFFVDVNGDKVRVEVEQGVVEVDDGRQVMRLGADEEVSVVRENSVQSPREVPETEGALEIQPDDSGLGDIETASPIQKERPGRPERVLEAEREIEEDEVAEILERIDSARRDARFAEAAMLLREVIQKHPFDSRTTAAFFTLGSVERSLGKHVAAAMAFQKCWKKTPAGPLAEDARAEEAESWSRARRDNMAKKAAEEYLLLYSEGIHRGRMERLIP